MSIGEWVLAIGSGAFFLLVLLALVGFVLRLFRETRPRHRRRRAR